MPHVNQKIIFLSHQPNMEVLIYKEIRDFFRNLFQRKDELLIDIF